MLIDLGPHLRTAEMNIGRLQHRCRDLVTLFFPNSAAGVRVAEGLIATDAAIADAARNCPLGLHEKQNW